MPKIKVADKPTVDEILSLLTSTEAGLAVLKGLVTTIKNDVATTKSKATDAVSYLTNSTYGLNALKSTINTISTTLNTVNNNVINVSGGGGGITPDNIVSFDVEKPDESDQVTITLKTPKDTIIDGHRLCNVLGAKVVKKVGSYPVNEKDGKLVVDAAIGPGATKTHVYTENDYKYATIYYKAFAYSDQYTFNRSTSNPGDLIWKWIICNQDTPLECVRIVKDTRSNFHNARYSLAGTVHYWMNNMWYRDEMTVRGFGGNYDTDKTTIGQIRRYYKDKWGEDLVFTGDYANVFNGFPDSEEFYSDNMYIYTKKKFNTNYLKDFTCASNNGAYGATIEGIPYNFKIYGSDSIPSDSGTFSESSLFNPFTVNKEIHLVFNHPRSMGSIEEIHTCRS